MLALGLNHWDIFALVWFILCWAGFTLYADYGPARHRSITYVMNRYRLRWMNVMLRRENRMVDAAILGNLLNGAAFFASTTIFVIGGLLAALSAGDVASAILTELPFTIDTTRTAWETKVLILVGIMVFAFFKFAWAFRLFNYSSVVIGATSLENEEDEDGPAMAERAAGINGLAARHFNRGLRAYFFALAALAWFIHPLLFIIASAWVVCVVQRREFRSRSLKMVREPLPRDSSPPDSDS
ncbi:MAG: DUF599 domain-containing protein [Pseudomonadota bacterium]